MTNEVLIKVENLSKKFCKDLKTSLWYGVKDLASGMSSNRSERELRPKEFWAVKDISFELRRGECLGLIGHNGAGKSTLLKILNGLINPDAGKVTIKGRVGALIELGAGFNPILSGRENIYNNGAILGFTRKEINEKVEEIIDFAEIREFIDMPVQNYSSGMKVRLGFAVAAQMEPDVLIIDEVLAVGDLGFRIKCLNRIGELLNNCAVIFVSHSMTQVSRVCTNALLLQKGKILVSNTPVSETIARYYQLFDVEAERILGKENITLNDVTAYINDEKYSLESLLNQGDKLKLVFDCSWLVNVSKIKCKIFFINADTRNVLDIASEMDQDDLVVNNDRSILTVETMPLFLNGGTYTITLVVQNAETDERLYRHDNIITITILSEYYSWSDVVGKGDWSIN
ncbi:lipopolysaccharide transport system ATP-binding protein [Ulvibacter sp. MAR_2010_11]|uniref:ABC transporter ATP-binding protein n=1 Tax=Ulvibacter sp. MAR_2010_11 TaxID=1250229 RepID=UPI000C2CB3FE|nr:ABC transporter ATP-binding protein [Ulvibacter sp. MAR_2010_11]PKA82140.1 lipopolysaccharide transport system ATP-binding protein [Ulvibacter sp. MAR_2010_11]